MPHSPTHDVKASRHVCSDCGRSYKAAETLNRHRKNHSDTTRYNCDICDSSFKRKDLLDRHSNIHASGRLSFSRSRSQRACDRCSRLKTRCDNLVSCTRCTKGGHECTYKLRSSRARTDRSSSTASFGSSAPSPYLGGVCGPSTPNAIPALSMPQNQYQQQQQPITNCHGPWPEGDIWGTNQWQWPTDVVDMSDLTQPFLHHHSTSLPPSILDPQCDISNLPDWSNELDPRLVGNNNNDATSMFSPPRQQQHHLSYDSAFGASPCTRRADSVWGNHPDVSALTSNGLELLSICALQQPVNLNLDDVQQGRLMAGLPAQFS